MTDNAPNRDSLSGGHPLWVNVIAVVCFVGLMAMILYPAGASHGDRIGPRCFDNLKQLAFVQHMYSEDHDGRLPSAAAWMDELGPFVKTEAIYHCPALRKTPEAYGYAMNAAVSDAIVSSIPSPKTTPLVFESVLLVRNATSGFYGLPDPPRHHGGNHVAFLDGHVNRLTPEKAARIGGSKRGD